VSEPALPTCKKNASPALHTATQLADSAYNQITGPVSAGNLEAASVRTSSRAAPLTFAAARVADEPLGKGPRRFRVNQLCSPGKQQLCERATCANAASVEGTNVLKAGDKVYIDGTEEEGTVKEVQRHEIVVRVKVSGGHEDRKYTQEDLRLDPTMGEASKFIDH